MEAKPKSGQSRDDIHPPGPRNCPSDCFSMAVKHTFALLHRL